LEELPGDNRRFFPGCIAGGIGFALALLMSRSPQCPPPRRWRYYG
jgi:hypothetical protein